MVEMEVAMQSRGIHVNLCECWHWHTDRDHRCGCGLCPFNLDRVMNHAGFCHILWMLPVFLYVDQNT